MQAQTLNSRLTCDSYRYRRKYVHFTGNGSDCIVCTFIRCIVNKPIHIYSESHDIGTIDPQVLITNIRYVHLMCFSFTTPVWTKNGLNLTDKKEKNGVLFTEILINGMDKYDCRGTRENGDVFVAHSTIIRAGK